MKIFFKGGRSGQCFLLQTGAKSTVTDLSEKRSLEFVLHVSAIIARRQNLASEEAKICLSKSSFIIF